MSEKLKFTEKLGFGLGEIMGCVNSVLAAFLTMFYTDSIGMAAGAVGTMIFVSKILDGITDLLAGTIIDKTRTKWGKARPWLLWMAVPGGLATVLLFMVPQNSSPTVQLVYAFITYNLYSSIIFTLAGIAKAALMVRMTYNDIERGALARYSLLFGLGGSILLMSTTFPMIFKFGNNTNAWRIVFGIYGIATTIALLLSFLLTKEKVGDIVTTDKNEVKANVSFKDGLKLFFKNKYFLIAGAVTIPVNFQTSINSAGQVYFYTYNMGNALLTTSLAMVTLIPTIISVLLKLPTPKRCAEP